MNVWLQYPGQGFGLATQNPIEVPEAREIVAGLYAAGAKHVTAADTIGHVLVSDFIDCDLIVVELSDKADERVRLFEIVHRHTWEPQSDVGQAFIAIRK